MHQDAKPFFVRNSAGVEGCSGLWGKDSLDSGCRSGAWSKRLNSGWTPQAASGPGCV